MTSKLIKNSKKFLNKNKIKKENIKNIKKYIFEYHKKKNIKRIILKK